MMKSMLLARATKLGFTLIELLVVIAILGILATIGIGSYASSQMKSRDSHRKTDLKNIAVALETFYNDVGAYPQANASGKIIGCGDPNSLVACEWGGSWQVGDVVYMAALPDDGSRYKYHYMVTGGGYYLLARLENTADPNAAKLNGVPTSYLTAGCGDVESDDDCNYFAKSTNVVNIEPIDPSEEDF